MKSRTADMIEGAEAWEEFRNAAKKVLSVPKSAIPIQSKKTGTTGDAQNGFSIRKEDAK